WFPPTNAIGALRVGKFAKYLHEAGHDVRVLSGRTAGDHTLPLEFPEDRVVRTPAWQVDELLDPLVSSVRRAARLAGLRRTSGETEGPQASPTLQNPELLLQSRLKRHNYALVQVPDSRNGWLGSAVRAGREVLKSWRPDVMVASAPPFTTLLVARRLSREFDLPWLAEFRDLWADNPYYGFPEWRRRIDDLRTLDAETRICSDDRDTPLGAHAATEIPTPSANNPEWLCRRGSTSRWVGAA